VFIEALDGGDVTKVFQEADINQLLPCSPNEVIWAKHWSGNASSSSKLLQL
jgi:hypothetical protein